MSSLIKIANAKNMRNHALWHLLAQENTISAQMPKIKETFEVVILFDGN